MLLFPILACAGAFKSDFAPNNYVSKTSLISLCFRGAPYLSDSHKSYSSRKKIETASICQRDGFQGKIEMGFRGDVVGRRHFHSWGDGHGFAERRIHPYTSTSSPCPVLQSDVHPHPLEELSGGHCKCTTLEAAPNWFQQPSPVQTALGLNKHIRHCSYSCVTITPLVMGWQSASPSMWTNTCILLIFFSKSLINTNKELLIAPLHNLLYQTPLFLCV